MMSKVSKVIMMGRIATDLELKFSLSGIKYVSFSLAVQRKFSENGEEKTDFFNCIAWEKTAEFICKYFGKGRMIAIIGNLVHSSAQIGIKKLILPTLDDELRIIQIRMV